MTYKNYSNQLRNKRAIKTTRKRKTNKLKNRVKKTMKMIWFNLIKRQEKFTSNKWLNK